MYNQCSHARLHGCHQQDKIQQHGHTPACHSPPASRSKQTFCPPSTCAGDSLAEFPAARKRLLGSTYKQTATITTTHCTTYSPTCIHPMPPRARPQELPRKHKAPAESRLFLLPLQPAGPSSNCRRLLRAVTSKPAKGPTPNINRGQSRHPRGPECSCRKLARCSRHSRRQQNHCGLCVSQFSDRAGISRLG